MPSATDTSNFLDNLYRTKFNREPDAAGKAYWAKELAAGNISRDNVSKSFDQSPEMEKIKNETVNTTSNVAAANTVAEMASTNTSSAVNNLANNNVTITASTGGGGSSSGPQNTASTTNTNSGSSSSGGGGGGGGGGSSNSNSNWLQDFYTENNINAGLLDDDAKTYWENEAATKGIEATKSVIEGTAKAQGNFGVDTDLDTFLADSYNEIFARQAADSGNDVYDQAGFDYWKNEILDGRTSRDDIVDHFNYANEKSGDQTSTATDGTTSTMSNDEAWLRSLYQNPDILNRDIGQEGLDYWLGDLAGTTDGRGGVKATRGEVLRNIMMSDEYACNQDSSKVWNGSSCVTPTATECPDGEVGTPPNCQPAATTCPAGQTGTPPNCVDETCPAGQTGTPPNCIDDTCPTGQTGTPPNCVDDSGDPVDTTCPAGYSGTPPNCTLDSGYNFDDDDDGGGNNTAGTWMGDEDSANTQTSYLNQKTKEYEDLYQTSLNEQANLNDALEEDRVRYGELTSRYGQLKADYEDARREADSYINAQRADETGQLRRGGTVSGNQASLGSRDLKSGSGAYGNNRDRDYGQVTEGPITIDDRPFARSGMKKGASTGATYFDNRNRFNRGDNATYY